MPLVKRAVSPTTTSRVPVPNGIQNDLEFNTNSTLSNVILQLSSLSKHAEDIFGELFREADLYFERTSDLQQRINRLGQTVTQLDSTAEEVSIVDIHSRKAFRSSVDTENEFFRRCTLPQCMLEAYNTCDQPPPLDRLDQFREDGKSSMKFYTDPDYFFELWRKEMEDNARQNRVQHKRRRRPTSNDKQKANVREATRTTHQHQALDVEFRQKKNIQNVRQDNQAHITRHDDRNSPSRPENLEIDQQQQQQTVANGDGPGVSKSNYSVRNGSVPNDAPQYQYPPPYQSEQSKILDEKMRARMSARPSQPPPAPPPDGSPVAPHNSRQAMLPPPPPPPPSQNGGAPLPMGVGLPVSPIVMAELRQHSLSPRHTPSPAQWTDPSQLPPPPPIPEDHSLLPPPPSPPMDGFYTGVMNAPSPPPPSPPPPPPMGQVALHGDTASLSSQASTMTSTSANTRSSDDSSKLANNDVVTARSGLLSAIRKGIQLRKVEQKGEERQTKIMDHSDVAAIIRAVDKRRQVIENESDSDYEDDDGDWDSS